MDNKQNNPGKGSAAPAALPSTKTPASLLPPTGGSVLSAMTVGALVLGLLVGFGSGVLWNRKHASVAVHPKTEVAAVDTVSTDNPDADAVNVTDTDVATPTNNTVSNGVTVSGQPAGSRVTVAHVALSADAWVAVHDDLDGKPGNILGAQWLPKGTYSNVKVDLLRQTKPGTTYLILVQDDANGNHKFENRLDLPEKDASGNVIMGVFKAE